MNTLNEYQAAALRTAPAHSAEHPLQARNHDLLHAAMGLVTEAGELMDALKRNHAYGKPVDLVNIREEAGDILWYVALLCRALETDMETIATINIGKLRVRYPEKFSGLAALNRNLTAERAVLEGHDAPCKP